MFADQNKFRRFNRFEVAEFDCPDHVFPKHSHEDYVLGANISGRENITLDRQVFEATTDQLTLYNPAQVQSSWAVSAEWSFVSIYLRPSDFAALTGLEQDVNFVQPVCTSKALSRSVARFVHNAIHTSADESMLELELATLLIDLLQVSGTSYSQRVNLSDAQMQPIAELLMDQMAELPRISDVAHDLGISSVALVRAFKKAYGLPPLEWINLQRINIARAQLRRGRPLSDIAFDLGYADQPHFCRRFKASNGLTPTMFKKLK